MATGTRKRHQGLAAVITVAGVLGISAWAMHRQQGQTESLSRVWVGEQWDVARDCFLGTPIGRGEGEAAIASRLDALLLETLAEAAESDDVPDPETMWPARCVGRLAALHVEPALLDGDPGDALTTIEILAPRVMGDVPEGPAAWALGQRRERLRALAEPLARLDEAMPPGAEYEPRDPARYADLAPLTLESVACGSAAPPTRPFFEGRAEQTRVLDEDSSGGRITRDDGAFVLSRAGATGVEERALEAGADRRAPRFLGERIVWAATDAPALLIETAGEPLRRVDLPFEAPARALAPCVSGDVAWVVLDLEGGPRLARLRAGVLDGVAAIGAGVPERGVRMACTEDQLALVWPSQPGRWVGKTCRERGCLTVEEFRAGADLRIAIGPDSLLALARGERTDLPLSQRFRAGRWGQTQLAVRGELSSDGGDFVIEACGERTARLAGPEHTAWAPVDPE